MFSLDVFLLERNENIFELVRNPSKADLCFCKNFLGNLSLRLKFIPAKDSSMTKSSSRATVHFPGSPLEAKATNFESTDGFDPCEAEATDSETEASHCDEELPPTLEKEETSEAVFGNYYARALDSKTRRET